MHRKCLEMFLVYFCMIRSLLVFKLDLSYICVCVYMSKVFDCASFWKKARGVRSWLACLSEYMLACGKGE